MYNRLDLISLVGPSMAVSIGAIVAIYIHWRRRKDNQAEQIKKKADAHKELWYALQEMQTQAKRPGGSDKFPHEMENPYDINWLRDHFRKNATLLYDINWLRDHFRKNATLLSKNLHDEYCNLIKQDIRSVFSDDWNVDLNFTRMANTKIRGNVKKRTLLLVDLEKMQTLALEEWQKLEGVYKQMNGLGSKFV